MSTESEPTEAKPSQPPNATLLAALYQVTARWYANDAQLIWRRIALFTTLNTGLLTAQVFASHLHLAVRVALPLLGIAFSCYWFALIRRTWRYQDFQAAVLRDQERAMGLEELGAFSRVWAIRHQPQPAEVEISGVTFYGSQLTGSLRNREFMKILIWVFICFHAVLLFVAVARVSLQTQPAASSSTPPPTTPTAKVASTPTVATPVPRPPATPTATPKP